MAEFPNKATAFKKGQSGNPKGRPPKLPQLDKLLDSVLGEEKDGMTAAEAILKALRLKAANGDVRAAEVLLDRAYGKAKQSIEQSGSIEVKQIKRIIIDPSDDNPNTSMGKKAT